MGSLNLKQDVASCQRWNLFDRRQLIVLIYEKLKKAALTSGLNLVDLER